MKNKIFCGIVFLLIIIITGFLFFNKKETIAVIGAMDVEIDGILSNLSNISYSKQNDFNIVKGNFNKYKIILSKSGVGKVNSATTTQFIIDKYKPNYIINTGIAGSLSSNLKPSEIIIAEKMVQYDFDLTKFGYSKGYMYNGIEPNKPTIYYSDEKLIKLFVKNKYIKKGTIATGDTFVADMKLKHSIKKDFNADAIDMESAAIAQTAKRNNIPVIIIRAISDGLEDTTNEYKQNEKITALKPTEIIIDILRSKK